jgi:hypothetical protein
MKTIWLLGPAAGVMAVACGILNSNGAAFLFSSGGSPQAVTNITRKGEIAAEVTSLEVDNSFGPVHIVGTDSAAGEWTWKLSVRAETDAAAQQFAGQTTCRAERDGNRLRLRVKFPDSNGKQSFESSLEIRAPKSVALRTQNRFGPTEVSGLAGEVEATGQHGPVAIRKVTGKVQAQTSFATLTVSDTGPASLKNQNGPLEASGIHGSLAAETSFAQLTVSDIGGPARLRNQMGAVEAARIAGNADIKTSFARLSVKGVEGDALLANQNGTVQASDIAGCVNASSSFAAMDIAAIGPDLICHNQNGPLRLHVISTTFTNVQAKTTFDTLEVRLPANPAPAIQARTTFAEVESDFPVLLKPRGQDPFADVAPGTPRVKLDNQNGRIRVRRD